MSNDSKMKTVESFVGKKRTAEVKQNKAGAYCVVVHGSDVKSPIKGAKKGVRFYGCRKGEEGKAKSSEIAQKLAKAARLPPAQRKKKK